MFSLFSSRAIARLTPGGVMPMTSAAAENVPASTTAAKTLMLPDSFSLLDLMVVRLNTGGGSRTTH
ncbi:hypothetical protein BCEN4_350087 [Burkholderia cenocepacia]|nr:hypothetical protein BCEN4_350087 [Burkholderia cenocepacia]